MFTSPRRVKRVARRWWVVLALVAAAAGWLLGARPPLAGPAGGPDAGLSTDDAPSRPRLEPRPPGPVGEGPDGPVDPLPARVTGTTLTVVVTQPPTPERASVVRLLGLGRDDGILWGREVVIAGGSTTAEVVAGPATTSETLPDAAVADTLFVALERSGAPLELAEVTWESGAAPRRGRAQLHLPPTEGIDLEGVAVTGQGEPVPDLALTLSDNPMADLVGTIEGRVRGARLGRTALLARTDAAGRFRVPGWRGGAQVYVRVATPGWSRIDDESQQTSFTASRAGGIPFRVAAHGRPTETATAMRVPVGEILLVPVKVFVPALPPEAVGGANNWSIIDLKTPLARPGLAAQSMGWSTAGSMPLPLPAGVRLLTTAVALESTAGLDVAAERGVGVVRFPGCDPATFPLRWQTLARLAPPEVRLEPRSPGGPSHVRFHLDGAPASLLELRDGLCSSLASVRDLHGDPGSHAASVWERGLRVSNGRLEGLFLYPGEYEVDLAIADRCRIQVAAGRAVDVRVRCRPLAGLDVRLDDALGGELESAVWVTRLAPAAPPPRPEPVETPVVGTGGTIGLRVGARAIGPQRQRFWFLEDNPRVHVVVYSTRGGPYAKEVRLSTGDTKVVAFP